MEAVNALAAVVLLAAAPVDLSGTWTLDTYLSDNPEQIAAAVRADLRLPNDEVAVGALGRGGGFGRRGSRDAASKGGKERTEIRPEDQKRIDDVTSILRYAPPTLRVSQTDASITLSDPQGTTRTLAVTGKREKQIYGDNATAADTTTDWEGPQLVSSIDIGSGRRMTLTYSIVPTTKQLMVRAAVERAPNEPGPFEITLVYDRVDR